jgi:hypothetical protein
MSAGAGFKEVRRAPKGKFNSPSAEQLGIHLGLACAARPFQIAGAHTISWPEKPTHTHTHTHARTHALATTRHKGVT